MKAGPTRIISESEFKSELKKEIEELFPKALVFLTDPQQFQGIGDLLILYRDKWASLECKRSPDSPRRPNQEFYISILDAMSFAAIVYPQNKDEVLRELQRAFQS